MSVADRVNRKPRHVPPVRVPAAAPVNAPAAAGPTTGCYPLVSDATRLIACATASGSSPIPLRQFRVTTDRRREFAVHDWHRQRTGAHGFHWPAALTVRQRCDIQLSADRVAPPRWRVASVPGTRTVATSPRSNGGSTTSLAVCATRRRQRPLDDDDSGGRRGDQRNHRERFRK